MNTPNKQGVDSSGSAVEPPAGEWRDPVIEAYKKDVDCTLLRENLKLTVEERFRKFESFAEYARELHEAGRRAAGKR